MLLRILGVPINSRVVDIMKVRVRMQLVTWLRVCVSMGVVRAAVVTIMREVRSTVSFFFVTLQMII